MNEDIEDLVEETYDFIVNEEDEVMLLLYVRDGEPKDPAIEINAEDQSAVLYRNDEDSILLEHIPDDIFDSLHDADTLLVCELSREETEEETQIIYAYEADISL